MGLILAISATATSTDFSAETPDIARIKEYSSLKVSILKFNAPPFILEQDGKLTGYDIEIARDIAAKLEVEVEFIRTATTSDDLVNTLIDNKDNIVICELSKALNSTQIETTLPLTLLVCHLFNASFAVLAPLASLAQSAFSCGLTCLLVENNNSKV